MLKYPGRDFAFSITAFMPPAVLTPKNSTISRAIVMTMLWIRSVMEAARKPPDIV